MSRASRRDLAEGRRSTWRPGELYMLPGASAHVGETVVWYQTTEAKPVPMVPCALCHGAKVLGASQTKCSACDGRGSYRDPVGPKDPLERELSRRELTRYTVEPAVVPGQPCTWHAPDLGGGATYYVVLVDDDREVPPLEWDDLQPFGIQRSDRS